MHIIILNNQIFKTLHKTYFDYFAFDTGWDVLFFHFTFVFCFDYLYVVLTVFIGFIPPSWSPETGRIMLMSIRTTTCLSVNKYLSKF